MLKFRILAWPLATLCLVLAMACASVAEVPNGGPFPQSVHEFSAGDLVAQTVEASPSAGLWKGTISNGYKGQTIGFRVSADGRTITDVIFHGYFIRRGGGIEDTDLAPLRDVAISGGSFNDTQLNEGALVRFDFTGTFTSSTTAEGTYRVMSDTTCDTYKLNWTATRVGN